MEHQREYGGLVLILFAMLLLLFGGGIFPLIARMYTTPNNDVARLTYDKI